MTYGKLFTHPMHFVLAAGVLAAISPSHGKSQTEARMTGALSPLTLDRIYEDPPLDGPGLREITWTEDGSRVGWLRPSEDNRDMLELWSYDVKSGQARRLVRASDIVSSEDLELSNEEIQILERKRITQRGITSYNWAPDGRSILFPLEGNLYVYDITSGTSVLLDEGGEGPVLDPRFSPDAKSVSFVRGGELWIIPSGGGTARQMTHSATSTISHGLAEFIAQEEMNRYRGYWWSHDSERIAYLEVDESCVEIWRRASYHASGTSVTEQRYPAAGRPNARVRVGILDVSSGRTTWIDPGKGVEYIARVDWAQEGGFLALQVQPRNQRWLRLVFVEPGTTKTHTILEEEARNFINLHDDLTFLADGSFLWSSERSGRRQLYLYDETGDCIRQLTHHDLPVFRIEGVDEAARTVLYSAATNRSLERHLFSVSLDGGSPAKLTKTEGWHTVKMSDDGRYYLDIQSSLLSPVSVTLHDATGEELAVLDKNDTQELDSYMRSEPEFIEITASDGTTPLNAMMIKPYNFNPSEHYPVLMYGYGGPHGHIITDRWSRSMLWSQFLAQNGYIVFSIDPRGSSDRGKSFEDEIFGHFGTVEVEDHVAAVEYLRTLPFVDSNRIGIWGWSYGGTLVLMSLLTTEGYFRCGIAVAPVTDWHWYDTHYTERYLGLPDENAGIYAAASPIEQDPAGLTEDLLLIHGMADDNVFLRNSLAFTEKLQKAGVQFGLMLYPGKTHSIAGKQTRRHLYGLMFEFLETHLKGN